MLYFLRNYEYFFLIIVAFLQYISFKTLEYLYTITYDLSNYKIDYEYQDDTYKNITYVNNTIIVDFSQQTKNIYNINYNTEDTIIEEIVINDWNGIYFKDNHEYSNIILDVGDYIISISVNLPKEQAIEIAKTIKKVE